MTHQSDEKSYEPPVLRRKPTRKAQPFVKVQLWATMQKFDWFTQMKQDHDECKLFDGLDRLCVGQLQHCQALLDKKKDITFLLYLSELFLLGEK